MTKKDICQNNASFAYYSGWGGVELKHIEYGINDYVYCVAGAWYGKKSYHKLRIYHVFTDSYFKLNGYKIWLGDCIRMQ